MLLSSFIGAQQLNHTWGFTTTGTVLTEAGFTITDSTGVTTLVFDLQDLYVKDFSPFTVNGATALLNTDAFFIGTLWYKYDNGAADSAGILIEAFPGFLINHPSDGSRITTTNVNFSITAITIQDSTTNTVGDLEWTPVNIYLNATDKVLPPEFLQITIEWKRNTDANGTLYYDFAYIAVYEHIQKERTTTRSDNNARKRRETIH